MLKRSLLATLGAVPSRNGATHSPAWRTGTAGLRAWGIGAWLAGWFTPRDLDRLISPPEVTRQRIRRERDLVAHGRPPFSVLVFDVGDPEDDPRPVRTLLRILRQRLRIGDEIGWILTGRLAVILPATDNKGALAVASDVEELLRRAGNPVPFTLPMGPLVDPGAQLAPRAEITAGRVRAINDKS